MNKITQQEFIDTGNGSDCTKCTDSIPKMEIKWLNYLKANMSLIKT